MKIVVLDYKTLNPGDLNFDNLEKLGDVTLYKDTDPTDETEIIKRIGDADIIIVNKIIISKKIIEACKNLKYIGVFATGYNNIDIKTAKAHGIIVTNCPNYSTHAVSQFTIGLLLEICHNTYRHSMSVMNGDWIKANDFCYWNYPIIELYDKTMGIIGFGNIGKNTGRIAKALGMKIITSGSRPTEEGRQIAEYLTMDELFKKSDVIALHCPLNEKTKEMINKNSISKMKDGVIILNTARGGLINEYDFKEALESGKIYGAGIDTVSVEPMKSDNPLLGVKNLIITPHIAWASIDTRRRLLDIATSNVECFIKGEPINVVDNN